MALRQSSLAGNVQVYVDGVASRLGDVRRDPGALLVQHVADDHLRALFREEPGLGFPLTACAAADEDNLAFQSH